MSVASVRLGVGSLGTGGGAEVSQGFSALGASDQDGVLSLGGSQGQLVEGEALTTGGQDALSSGFGEAQGADLHLGEFEDTFVVQDLGDDHLDLVGVHLDQAREGQGVSLDSRLLETLEHDSVELGISSSGQEAI